MDGLKVGIIGAGNMGSVHFNCIYSGEIEGMRVTAVCDTDRRKLKEIREKSSGVALYEDYRELLDNPEVDGVIIAVPHPLHTQIAIVAFEKGRHVLMEKPVYLVSRAKASGSCAEEREYIRYYAQPTYVQPTHQFPVPQGARNGSKRPARRAETQRLDHHQLVPDAGVL